MNFIFFAEFRASERECFGFIFSTLFCSVSFLNVFFMRWMDIRPRFVIISWYVTCALCYMWRMAQWRCDNFRLFIASDCRYCCWTLCVCVFSLLLCVLPFFPISLVAICYCSSLDANWFFSAPFRPHSVRVDRCLWPLSERKMSIGEIQTMKNDRNELHTNIHRFHVAALDFSIAPVSHSLFLYRSIVTTVGCVCVFIRSILCSLPPSRLVHSLLNWFYWRVQFKFYFEITHQTKPFFFSPNQWLTIYIVLLGLFHCCSSLLERAHRVDDRMARSTCTRIFVNSFIFFICFFFLSRSRSFSFYLLI